MHRRSSPRILLDQRFRKIRSQRLTPPVHGWVKAIRQSLGMTSAQLAKRMGVKQPSVTALEQSEVKGTIELATLRRVAAALDCTVIYALVPNQPLETVVRDRTRALARRRLADVEHSMLLENQAVDSKDFEARVEELMEEISPRQLWNEI